MDATKRLIVEQLEGQAARAANLGHNMEEMTLTWEGPEIPGTRARYVHYARRCRACEARVQVTVEGTEVWEVSLGSADRQPCTPASSVTYEQAYARAMRRLQESGHSAPAPLPQ